MLRGISFVLDIALHFPLLHPPDSCFSIAIAVATRPITMNPDTNTATTTSNQKTSSSKPKVTASASDAATNTTDATTTRAKSSTRATGTSTHTISVGPPSNPHQYEPHEVDAIPGDTILFKFMSKNHSVTQAEAGAPCVPPSQGEFFFSGNFLDEVKLDSSGRLETDVSSSLSHSFCSWI